MEIRLLKPQDWPQVSKLFETGKLPGAADPQTTTGVVIVDEGTVRGFCGLYFVLMLENFWLDESLRNKGFLEKMLDTLGSLPWGKDRGFYFFSKRPAEEKIARKFKCVKENSWKVWRKVF